MSVSNRFYRSRPNNQLWAGFEGILTFYQLGTNHYVPITCNRLRPLSLSADDCLSTRDLHNRFQPVSMGNDC